MSRKQLIFSFNLLFVTALIIILPTTTQAQQRLNENFIFINYIGQALTLDLDDVTYIIPGTDVAPEGGPTGSEFNRW